jgi:hypothetical protein
MSVCITRRIMEFRTIKLQSVLLHYGNEWLWLTAAEGSGLLWNTAEFHNNPLLPAASYELPDDGVGTQKHVGAFDWTSQ